MSKELIKDPNIKWVKDLIFIGDTLIAKLHYLGKKCIKIELDPSNIYSRKKASNRAEFDEIKILGLYKNCMKIEFVDNCIQKRIYYNGRSAV